MPLRGNGLPFCLCAMNQLVPHLLPRFLDMKCFCSFGRVSTSGHCSIGSTVLLHFLCEMLHIDADDLRVLQTEKVVVPFLCVCVSLDSAVPAPRTPRGTLIGQNA